MSFSQRCQPTASYIAVRVHEERTRRWHTIYRILYRLLISPASTGRRMLRNNTTDLAVSSLLWYCAYLDLVHCQEVLSKREKELQNWFSEAVTSLSLPQVETNPKIRIKRFDHRSIWISTLCISHRLLCTSGEQMPVSSMTRICWHISVRRRRSIVGIPRVLMTSPLGIRIYWPIFTNFVFGSIKHQLLSLPRVGSDFRWPALMQVGAILYHHEHLGICKLNITYGEAIVRYPGRALTVFAVMHIIHIFSVLKNWFRFLVCTTKTTNADTKRSSDAPHIRYGLCRMCPGEFRLPWNAPEIWSA